MLPASLAAKWLPREFVEATRIGGTFTVLAYAVMLVLFKLQLSEFLHKTTLSSLLLDFNDGPNLQINFDIDMFDIECRNLQVVVMDELREEPIRNIAKEYVLHVLNSKGAQRGVHSHKAGTDADEDEWFAPSDRQRELEQADGRAELDSDWASSHDGFKHKAFEHVIEYHDFTLINFFAEWCSHCRKFAPSWNQLAGKVNNEKQFTDQTMQTRQVRALKMNCVDFSDLCRQKGIHAFPTIRLYKSDGTFSSFDGERNEGSIIRWISMSVGASKGAVEKDHFSSSHEDVKAGCNMKGFVRVPRVPGHLELMAGGGDQNLEPSMTNVSHRVRHLSFCSPGTSYDPSNYDMCDVVQPLSRMKYVFRLPMLATAHTTPLDMKTFATSAFHQAYEHHLRLVSTVTNQGEGTAYQFSHYGRTARLNTSTVPQARFYFDFEPFALSISYDEKQWYQFGTSLLAILGGVFVMMRLCAMMSITVAGTATRSATPAGSRSARSNGLLT